MAAMAVIFDIKQPGADDALDVDAGMLVEVLILRRDERVGDKPRDRLDRKIEPALGSVFRKQRAVGRMHARHDRRFVVLKLRVVGQVLGKMPQQACRRGDPGDEQNRAGSKQKAQESQ